MKIHRMSVEALSHDGDYEEMGSVLLPDYAAPSEVEHALVAVGVYAPRGADSLEWHDTASYPSAWIRDGGGEIIVRIRRL
jgi:hypothetical protein